MSVTYECMFIFSCFLDLYIIWQKSLQNTTLKRHFQISIFGKFSNACIEMSRLMESKIKMSQTYNCLILRDEGFQRKASS